ncbi:MAG: winged helix-turn-helix transcriptional regulator, partial [Paludibacteraceae bacterium]|nr:winged helix-turn-helix transcriptional regulator [Paludibacteraceae bacterium]
IADIFKDAGLIEKYGSGIRRIRESFIKASTREPRFEEIGEGFMVTIFPFTPQKTPQKKSGTSGPGTAILQFLSQNPGATRNHIATALGYSSETVKEYLEKLKRTGELTRTGGRKMDEWVVQPRIDTDKQRKISHGSTRIGADKKQ